MIRTDTRPHLLTDSVVRIFKSGQKDGAGGWRQRFIVRAMDANEKQF